jgi:hypothetical protein
MGSTLGDWTTGPMAVQTAGNSITRLWIALKTLDIAFAIKKGILK